MLRMAEAHAKMHLRDTVKSEDVDVGMKMLLESFIQSLKTSIASVMRPKLIKFLSQPEDDNELLYHILKNYVKSQAKLKRMVEESTDPIIDIEITKEDFMIEAKNIAPIDIERFMRTTLFTKEFVLENNKIKTRIVV